MGLQSRGPQIRPGGESSLTTGKPKSVFVDFRKNILYFDKKNILSEELLVLFYHRQHLSVLCGAGMHCSR